MLKPAKECENDAHLNIRFQVTQSFVWLVQYFEIEKRLQGLVFKKPNDFVKIFERTVGI